MNKKISTFFITPIACLFPYHLLKTMSRAKLIMPFYHMVSSDSLPHIRYLYSYRNPDRFRKDIDFFLRHYQIIDLTSLVKYIKGDSKIPENALFLSFDDGFREMHDVVAPILKEKGTPATFFICTAFLDNKDLFYRCKASLLIHAYKQNNNPNIKKIKSVFRNAGIFFHDFTSAVLSINYNQRPILEELAPLLETDFNHFLRQRQPYMTSAQVHQLVKDGFSVGAHSIDHPVYHELAMGEQIRQTIESIMTMKEKFSVQHNSFAFPFEDFNVKSDLYSKLHSLNIMDISFGTSGIKNDVYPYNFQRFIVEGNQLSIKNIIKINYLKKIIGNISGRSAVIHT